jgi:Domain of unknown function (DUF4062)
MEDFGARDANAKNLCARLVRESDLFVGLMGHYYGSCPPTDTTSYTELEYRTATAANIPRLMFAAPDEFPIPASLRESDASFETGRIASPTRAGSLAGNPFPARGGVSAGGAPARVLAVALYLPLGVMRFPTYRDAPPRSPPAQHPPPS